MAGLKIDHVTKNFAETEVLKGVSLDVADGEFVSLVGPSGCGKSTLLRIIAGLEEPTSGDIRLGDKSVARVRAADRNLSMVFQSYALYPHLSVAENIAVPLKLRKLSAAQRAPILGRFMPGAKGALAEIGVAIENAAEMLDILPLLNRKPGHLSGGQRQRVALARALVRDPAAFLLDEPLSNLDAKLRVQTRVEIAQLHRQLRATFIYVTHDQVEAMTMSDRIAVMMSGEILQCASPAEIYENPNDLRVAEFIGSPKINVLPVAQSEHGLTLLGQPLGLTAERAVTTIALRPEALCLAGSAATLTGTVAHTENLGAEIFAQIAVAGLDTPIVLRAEPQDRPRLSLGALVGLSFDPAAALLFDAKGKRVRGAPIPARTLEGVL